MYNVRGYLVQEGSVVTDYEDGAWVGKEIIRQESDRGNVQHVRRFVEKQQVRT